MQCAAQATAVKPAEYVAGPAGLGDGGLVDRALSNHRAAGRTIGEFLGETGHLHLGGC